MISCRFVPISCQKGVLFFETPGMIIRTVSKVVVIAFKLENSVAKTALIVIPGVPEKR